MMTALSSTGAPANSGSPIRAGRIPSTPSSTPTASLPKAISRWPRCRDMCSPPSGWRRAAPGGWAVSTWCESSKPRRRLSPNGSRRRSGARNSAPMRWRSTAQKRQCRVHSSNAGQLLFTGIVREDRARRVAADLMSRRFFSGWGIRTIAQGEARYNPMSYHNGSIWPHDNALIALGFARYGLKHRWRICSRACSTPQATWTCGGCRNCSAVSGASASAGRCSIRSPARRRPGRAARHSPCWKRRSASNSMRRAARSACAIRACRNS